MKYGIFLSKNCKILVMELVLSTESPLFSLALHFITCARTNISAREKAHGFLVLHENRCPMEELFL